MKKSNRRQVKRLRIDKGARVPIYISQDIPFIGDYLYAESINISIGGIALKLKFGETIKKFKKGSKIKVHFRLPGHNLQACQGRVQHFVESSPAEAIVGIRFVNLPKKVSDEIKQMILDNDACDKRISEDKNPWCLPTCAFYKLCRKPLRSPQAASDPDNLELAFQKVV